MISVKSKIKIILGVYFAIFLALGFGSYFLVSKIKDESGKYLKMKNESSDIEEKKKLLSAARIALLNSKDAFAEAEKSFLLNEEIPGFIASLEKVAANSNVEFQIQYVSSVESPENPNLNFSVSMSGMFSDAMEFISGLENVPFPPYRLVEIKQLTLSRGGGSGSQAGGNLVGAKIDMRVYMK